jgi:Domain of unknown function (DUF6848)
MDKPYITTIDAWKLSYRNEILADLQHSLNGLMPGTILKSKESGNSWKVVARIIFMQADNQKRFEGEKEYSQRFTFKKPQIENYERFQKDIADKESKGIHQYSLSPVGHDDKPKMGEILEVEQ